MYDVREAAKKYLEDTVTDVDSALSNLLKKKSSEATSEPEPLVKGDVQRRLTDKSVDNIVSSMKGLSKFLFGIGVNPHTWALTPPKVREAISLALLPKGTSYDLPSRLRVELKYPRRSERELLKIKEDVMNALSSSKNISSEVGSFIDEFVSDPNKTVVIPTEGTSDHVVRREFPELFTKEKEMPKLASEELIAADTALIELALHEVKAADRDIKTATETIEAARERKRKWIKGINLKKGRLTKYKRPGESMNDAAERALGSDDPSVRSMGSFYKATRKFKKGKNA